jgi:hypothetical protein
MAGRSHRDRVSLRALALGGIVALVGCTGGPHPLPPERGLSMNTPNSASPSATGPKTGFSDNPTGTPTIGSAGSASVSTETPAAMGAAGATAAAPPAQSSGDASMTSGGAGTGAGAAVQPPAPTTPAGMGQTPASGAAGGPPQMPAVCDGETGALSASETAPTTLLFVLDRSVEMASDFQGEPRYQRAAEALMHTLNPRGDSLTIGAVLYPSASTTARACNGPDWFCQLQGSTMCAVNPMASQDQVAFQPATRALTTLVGPSGVYAPVAGDGVPLFESLQRADAALAAQPAGDRTSVVVVASGTPSCGWDSARASAIVDRWRTERGVRTYAITLPSGATGTSDALAALAQAGGTATARSPQSVGALEAMLQSIAIDSMSSCSLELDPPATDLNSVQVLVTDLGVEQVLPRSSTSGEALWTISSDGKTVTLLGTACEAATAGEYDGIRIVLSCAR